MSAVNQTSRILGVAFILQFVTSFGSGVLLQPALIVPDNISESMIRIAHNPALMKACGGLSRAASDCMPLFDGILRVLF